MTEAEWRECTDPQNMLRFLRGKVSDRKLRLFACACCRRIWHLFTDERSRTAVEIGEQFADHLCGEEQLERANQSAYIVTFEGWGKPKGIRKAAVAPVNATSLEDDVHEVAASTASAAIEGIVIPRPTTNPTQASDLLRTVEHTSQAELLRCIFGTPFRPISIDPSWLTWHVGTIPKLAQAIYDERAFDRMPILADALEEARCQDQDIVNHCRQPGEHVRGCWVDDLLLGKE